MEYKKDVYYRIVTNSNNTFTYIAKILSNDNNFITILDKYNKVHTININSIISYTELLNSEVYDVKRDNKTI